MTRQDLIPPLTVELAPAYRLGVTGRRYFTRKAAYLAAARAAYHDRYHEPEDILSGDVPFALTPEQQQRSDEHRLRVVERLAKWLQWRDGRRAAR